MAKRSKPGRPPALSLAKQRDIELLRHRRGVIGVFWGNARRKGTWTDERTLVVHVRKKMPANQLGRDLVPKRVAGFRTDVIAVGAVQHQWLDPTDLVRCDDASRGRSTMTVLAKRQSDDRVYAVLSGHGTLPAQHGQLVTVFDPAIPMDVRALDPAGMSFDGSLEDGLLDDTCDFSLALMETTPDDINSFHQAAGEFPPLELRASGGDVDDEVSQFSAIRGRMMVGRIRQIAITHVLVPGFGGQDFPYFGIYFVESPDAAQPFSVKGDSGSLVVDRRQRVLGTVVAGDPTHNLSYVLPIAGTVGALGARAKSFFRPEGS